jgi:hypothetical protein
MFIVAKVSIRERVFRFNFVKLSNLPDEGQR